MLKKIIASMVITGQIGLVFSGLTLEKAYALKPIDDEVVNQIANNESNPQPNAFSDTEKVQRFNVDQTNIEIYCGGQLKYKIDEDTKQATVLGLIDNQSQEPTVTIPNSIEKEGVFYTVTKIGEQAFYKCENLKTVNLVTENNLKVICKQSFKGCSQLEVIPLSLCNNLEKIEDEAFYATNLLFGYIPYMVTTLGKDIYKDCPRLQNLTTCNSASTEAKIKLFDHMTSPTLNVVFEKEQVQRFNVDQNYQDIYCGGQLKYKIDEDKKEATVLGLIDNQYQELILNIPKNIEKDGVIYKVTKIGERAFYKCGNLKEVKLAHGNSLKLIEKQAFKYCHQLEFISFIGCNCLETIEEEAFYATNLLIVDIPKPISTLGKNIYKGCTRLQCICIDSNFNDLDIKTPNASFVKKSEEDDQKTWFLKEHLGVEQVELSIYNSAITLKETYTDIFKLKDSLKNIQIPETEKELLEIQAKYKNIEMPKLCLKYLPKTSNVRKTIQVNADVQDDNFIYALDECSQTATIIRLIEENPVVEIPDKLNFNDKIYNVTIIGEDAFSNTKISQVIISKCITKICKRAFLKCRNLETVLFKEGTDDSDLDESQLSIIESEAFVQTNIKEITIKKLVTTIGSKAFFECKRLEKVNIEPGSQLKEICKEAFSKSAIKMIKFPMNIESIQDKAFFQCNQLENIEFECFVEKSRFIPQYMKTVNKMNIINQLVFSETNLKKVYLPDSIQQIRSGAFYKCKNLTFIDIERSLVKKISDSAFSETALKGITLPHTTTEIVKRAFENCKNLKYVNQLSGCQNMEIGSKAFAGCNITIFYLPAYFVEMRTADIFKGSDLKMFYYKIGTSLAQGIFQSCKLETMVLPPDSLPRGAYLLDSIVPSCTVPIEGIKELLKFIISEETQIKIMNSGEYSELVGELLKNLKND